MMDLDAIEARANEATEGPWSAEIHYHRATGEPVLFEVHPVAELEGNGDGGTVTAADAEFVAAARMDVPALVARVRELEAENQRMRDSIASRIVKEEQRVQQEIAKEPLNSRLAGLLFGLQRGRDIVTSGARDIAKEEK
ncbi:hypothetical protein ABZ635_22020 [Nocardiopsis sp. NPDC007018]|uniref:hypothetical protein n=1 Tax=Nocardiopsis sp. NPDC007018 TaxID=3155721 RepID=UPI0033F53746